MFKLMHIHVNDTQVSWFAKSYSILQKKVLTSKAIFCFVLFCFAFIIKSTSSITRILNVNSWALNSNTTDCHVTAITKDIDPVLYFTPLSAGGLSAGEDAPSRNEHQTSLRPYFKSVLETEKATLTWLTLCMKWPGSGPGGQLYIDCRPV